MQIVGVRPANVTGTEKINGSMEHVRCIVLPARNLPVEFPYRDNMYSLIHVEDIADIFAFIYMMDNKRLREEFDVTLSPLTQRVKEMINDVRAREGLPLVP